MVKYNGPVGEMVENPSEEFIREIFLHKDAAYWKQGSGDSCFEVEGCDEWIIFFYDEPYGFFMMTLDYMVPFDSNIEIEIVEHFVGGEPLHVPTCSYVNRETAYNIIIEFIKTKCLPTLVLWKDLYEIIEFEG